MSIIRSGGPEQNVNSNTQRVNNILYYYNSTSTYNLLRIVLFKTNQKVRFIIIFFIRDKIVVI